jgi:hypothetical protein
MTMKRAIRLALAVGVLAIMAGCNLPGFEDEEKEAAFPIEKAPQVQAEQVIIQTGDGTVDTSTSGTAAQ